MLDKNTTKPKVKLTTKQADFVQYYCIGDTKGNATQSAILAGYSKRTAYAIGIENLKKPRIIDDVIRSLLSGTISLLAKHGYEKAAHELDTILGNPLRRDDRLDWSSTMDATIESYFDLHKQLSDIIAKIKNTERERVLAEAEDLWKRA